MKSNVIRLANNNSPATSLNSAIKSFNLHCNSRNLSKCTIDYYNYSFLAFTKFTDLPPIDITTDTIRAFLVSQSEHINETTLQHRHCALNVFFKFLTEEGYLESNPVERIPKPKRKKSVINTFSNDDMEGILKVCKNDFVGIRDRAIILLMFDSGLRASELCGIKLNDIDWTENTVLVLGKNNKERTSPFGTSTKQAINNYLSRRPEVDHDNLFISTLGNPLDRYGLRAIVSQVCKKADITGVRCSPHTFRHTSAVSYLRAGGDVFSLQKLLGHEDLSMTRRYAELSQSDVIEKHRQFSPADKLQSSQTTGRKRLR